jgi:hypothetical protein
MPDSATAEKLPQPRDPLGMQSGTRPGDWSRRIPAYQ